ncbi:hypothetical protein So717_00120 [Roseobacter cerasinus]|uniref:Uncharacterized protein n=1 Tax=Roseobacter cerasinus TaxID=2602289 RepID=A0A640VJL7_9RHOB|nr:hypothetical protein [Roseobacter cerasinus]GFE48259.1 hypothetical protein So717_00120 [Roseobacter cerasinus]
MILTSTNFAKGYPISADKGIALGEALIDMDVEWDVLIGTPAMKEID